MWCQLSITCSNLPKYPNVELLVAIDHNKLRTMASETVDPIDWSQPPPSRAVPPERLVHSINRCNSATAEILFCNLATFSMRGQCGYSGYVNNWRLCQWPGFVLIRFLHLWTISVGLLPSVCCARSIITWYTVCMVSCPLLLRVGHTPAEHHNLWDASCLLTIVHLNGQPDVAFKSGSLGGFQGANGWLLQNTASMKILENTGCFNFHAV